MAEIKLERKKGPAWPWILLALLLLLLIGWAIWAAMGRQAPDVVAPTDTVYGDTALQTTAASDTATAGLPQEVQNYIRTCSAAEGAEPETMGREHEFSTNCMELLASSMSAVATQRQADPNITEQIEAVRQQASDIRQSDPTSLNHSSSTRRAAEAAATALTTMQRAFAGTDQQAQATAEQVRQAAQQISADQPLLDQKDALRRFFREAGNTLQRMAAGQTAP